jgi:hypothetical protein
MQPQPHQDKSREQQQVADEGRVKHKSGGEPQKQTKDPRESRERTGSSKQRKG